MEMKLDRIEMPPAALAKMFEVDGFILKGYRKSLNDERIDRLCFVGYYSPVADPAVFFVRCISIDWHGKITLTEAMPAHDGPDLTGGVSVA
jgi:hypothetical protein